MSNSIANSVKSRPAMRSRADEDGVNVSERSDVVSVVGRRKPDDCLADLERLYREQFSAFLRTATAYLGDIEAGRDAVQDGVASAIRHRSAFRGDGSLEAWLWRIVLNAIRSRYREAAHRRMLAVEGLEYAAVAASENGSVPTDVVRAAVRRLPERQRLVLFLRFYGDMEYDAIAELLDISRGTVAASLNAARATLRGLLKEVPT